MDCNKLKTNTPKATWEGYDILGECHNGSFKKTFLAKKDSLYYMISCVPNIVENKKELGIMSSIKNCEYIIKLVGSFIITPDSLNQLEIARFLETYTVDFVDLFQFLLIQNHRATWCAQMNGNYAGFTILC
jgi:hypothetical protein